MPTMSCAVTCVSSTPPHASPSFTPPSLMRSKDSTLTLYISHPESTVFTVTFDGPSAPSMSYLLGSPAGLLSSVFNIATSILAKAQAQDDVCITQLALGSSTLYCVTSSQSLYAVSGGRLVPLEETDPSPNATVTLASSASSDLVIALSKDDMSPVATLLRLEGETLAERAEVPPGQAVGVGPKGDVVIVDDDEVWSFTFGGPGSAPARVETVGDRFASSLSRPELRSALASCCPRPALSSVLGGRPSERIKSIQADLRSSSDVGSAAYNSYKRAGAGTDADALHEVGKKGAAFLKCVRVEGDTVGRVGCVTKVVPGPGDFEDGVGMEAEEVIKRLEDFMPYGDVFERVAVECKAAFEARAREGGSDVQRVLKGSWSWSGGGAEGSSWLEEWCCLKKAVDDAILAHAMLTLGHDLEECVLDATEERVVRLLGKCYARSPAGGQEAKAAALALWQDKMCREADECRARAGRWNRWSGWCARLEARPGSLKKFWRAWEELQAGEGGEQGLREAVIEACPVRSYIVDSEDRERAVVSHVCNLEVSRLLSRKPGWLSLPQAADVVRRLIELECNLALLNTLSSGSGGASEEVAERCAHIAGVCDAANFNGTDTAAQVHSLLFETRLKAGDYSACLECCMDKRNQDFGRRKGMCSRLAVSMVSAGKLSYLIEMPMVVMTGAEGEACDSFVLAVSSLVSHGYGDEAAALAGGKGEWRVAAVCAKSDVGKVACLSMVKKGERRWIVKDERDGDGDRVDRFRTVADIVKETQGREEWAQWTEGCKWIEAEDYGRVVYGDDATRFGVFLNRLLSDLAKVVISSPPGEDKTEEWCAMERVVRAYGDSSNGLAINLARELMRREEGSGDLPVWLTSLLTGGDSGPDSLFATKASPDACDENAPALMRLYMEYGLYVDALKVASLCLGSKEERTRSALENDMASLQFHVPYNALDLLFELVDETLDGGLGYAEMPDDDKEELRRYRIETEDKLKEHFEALKIVQENEAANRARWR